MAESLYVEGSFWDSLFAGHPTARITITSHFINVITEDGIFASTQDPAPLSTDPRYPLWFSIQAIRDLM